MKRKRFTKEKPMGMPNEGKASAKTHGISRVTASARRRFNDGL